MNFFEHQARARRQSRWLLAVFTLAVAAIVVAVNGVVLLALMSTSWDPLAEGMTFRESVRAHLPLLAGTAVACIALIFVASLFRTLALKAGGGQVARQLGGTQVDPSTRDPLRRRLYNVVEEIALASGVPVPEVYVLDREAGINAFAAGFTPSDAAVAVTRGTLEKLSRNELQGVIAHEFSHILNGDMRINIRLMGTLFGILLLALIGRKVLTHARFAGGSSRDKGGAIVVLIALGLMIVGYVGLFFGRWIKAAVSRQREYLADASAVQFTRDPDGIGGALKKIAVYSDASYLDTDTEEVSHMLFGDGRRMRLFSTHPPLNERIARVDPGFQPDDLARLAAKIQHERVQAERAEREAATAADSGARRSAFDPRSIIERIGQPDFQQVLAAAALAAALPDPVARAARSPEWAGDVLFYTLLDRDPDVRQRQLLAVAEIMGEDSEQRVRALADAAGPVRSEQQLPLLELAFPQVRQRPPEYVGRVLKAVKAMAEADRRIDPFEFLLARSIAQQLWETWNPDRVRLSGDRKLADALGPAAAVLAVLARHGHRDEASVLAAWRAGWRELGAGEASMPAAGDWVAELDAALPELDRLRAADKETLLRGMIETVLHDGALEPAELELLRAVSALIHVPLPLLTAGPQSARRS